MNESVLLDFLISNSCGDVLYFDDRNCNVDFLKEAILRGFQIQNINDFFRTTKGCGFGFFSFRAVVFEFGNSLGMGDISGDGYPNQYCPWIGSGETISGKGWGDGDGASLHLDRESSPTTQNVFYLSERVS